MKNIQIEVCERSGDWYQVPHFVDGNFVGMVDAPKYHASIKGKPGIWAAGKSIAESIGDLVNSHPEQFRVNVTMIGKQPR